MRLVHALEDEEVPFSYAQRLVERCSTTNAELLLVKGEHHSLEGERAFNLMRAMIKDVIVHSHIVDLTSPGCG